MECRKCELQENINKTSMKYIFQVINEDVNLKKCALIGGDCEVIQGKFIK
jgi:hydrogenase maturation factor